MFYVTMIIVLRLLLCRWEKITKYAEHKGIRLTMQLSNAIINMERENVMQRKIKPKDFIYHLFENTDINEVVIRSLCYGKYVACGSFYIKKWLLQEAE